MRSHFYALLNDLSARTRLPFDSNVQGSRVRFKVDKAYSFGLALDNTEEFLVFECTLLDRRFMDADPLTYLRLNFSAAHRDGCFVSIDPHTECLVLVARLLLPGLAVERVIETMERMLNIADAMVKGEFSRGNSSSNEMLDFFSQMRA